MSARREERYETTLAVRLKHGTAVAKNVSASGIYFETEVPLEEATPIHFTIEFADSPTGPLRIRCEARVVRVEQKDGKIGVGASIINSTFERIENDAP